MLIPTKNNTKSITDLREDTLSVLRDADRLGHVYIFNRSDPTGVLLSVEEFTFFQEILEERQDMLDAMELEKEDRGDGIPIEEIKKEFL
ncbi:hypothetical protein KC726_05965 [Candidatus Woesebacteria bacterium]|nr:hypothetical protein [Candidatus Woesebacteria bacterium]